MFPKFVSFPALEIGLYLFLRKNVYMVWFKKRVGKNMMFQHLRFQENDDLPLGLGNP